MDYIVQFIVSVIAGVVANGISKWLDRGGKDHGAEEAKPPVVRLYRGFFVKPCTATS